MHWSYVYAEAPLSVCRWLAQVLRHSPLWATMHLEQVRDQQHLDQLIGWWAAKRAARS